jgi:hypothetical protein
MVIVVVQGRVPAAAGLQPAEGSPPVAVANLQPRQAWHRARRPAQASGHHARLHHAVSIVLTYLFP